MSSYRPQPALKRQENITVIAVVGVGYLATFIGSFSGASLSFTLAQALLAIALGLVYLFFLLHSEEYFQRFASYLGTALYFIIQLILVLVVQFLLLGPGIWLIPLPIIGVAVERVPARWRWPIYLFTILGPALSISVRTGDWSNAWNVSLLLVPAVLFVVVVTQLQLSEREARRDAERLSTQLEDAHEQLAAYAVQIEELATTKERNRLARDIHDNLGHYLTVVNVQLEASRVMMSRDPERALDAVSKAQGLTQEGLAAVRQSVSSLRESPVGNQPLTNLLETLLEEISAAGIVTGFELVGRRRQLDADAKLTLYRIAQEGLTNVRKHARASRVGIVLDYQARDKVRLVLTDNGIGSGNLSNGGFGLVGMKERVQLLGGELQIETATGKGFTLDVVVPG